MGGRFTEIPQETFEQIVVDAGVLLRKFDLFDPDYDITPDIITATTGGVELSAEMEITDLGEDVDNCANDTMELARLTSWNCRIASTAIGSSPEIMQMILGAADLSGDIDVIPRAVLELSDFKDLWWVGDRVDGGLLAVHIANALSISGLSLQTTKAQKGQFGFEIQAHVSIYDLDRVPMTFYVMAPGAWEITGLALEDFFVEKGVPTQVPVKFLMGDGSVMEPSDYGHNFSYGAAIPTGGSITQDGILTLVGSDDRATIAVSYTHGDTVLSTEGMAQVIGLAPVDLTVINDPIELLGGNTAQVNTVITLSDGTTITPADTRTGFTYRLEGAPEGTSINESGVITAGPAAGECTVHVTYTANGHLVAATGNVVNAGITLLAVLTTDEFTSATKVKVQLITRVTSGVYIDLDDGNGVSPVNNPTGLKPPEKTYPAGRARVIKVYGASNSGKIQFQKDMYKAFREIWYNGYVEQSNNVFDPTIDFSMVNLRKFTVGDSIYYRPIGVNAAPVIEEIVYERTTGMNTINNPICVNVPTLKRLKLGLSTISFGQSGRYNTQIEAANLEVLDISNLIIQVTIGADTIKIPSTCRILVKESELQRFKTFTNWSQFADQYEGV